MTEALVLFMVALCVLMIFVEVVAMFVKREVFGVAIMFLCFGALIGEVWGPVEHMRCYTEPDHTLCQSVASTEGGAP